MEYNVCYPVLISLACSVCGVNSRRGTREFFLLLPVACPIANKYTDKHARIENFKVIRNKSLTWTYVQKQKCCTGYWLRIYYLVFRSILILERPYWYPVFRLLGDIISPDRRTGDVIRNDVVIEITGPRDTSS